MLPPTGKEARAELLLSVRIAQNSLLKVLGLKKKIGKYYSLLKRTAPRNGLKLLSTYKTVLANSAVRGGTTI